MYSKLLCVGGDKCSWQTRTIKVQNIYLVVVNQIKKTKLYSVFFNTVLLAVLMDLMVRVTNQPILRFQVQFSYSFVTVKTDRSQGGGQPCPFFWLLWKESILPDMKHNLWSFLILYKVILRSHRWTSLRGYIRRGWSSLPFAWGWRWRRRVQVGSPNWR